MGSETRLGASGRGLWHQLTFVLDSPNQANPGYDPEGVVSMGVHVFGGGGPSGARPTPAVVYLDNFTIE